MNSRPLLTALHVVGATMALLVLAVPAQADSGDPNVNCGISVAADKTINKSYMACSDHYEDGIQDAPRPPAYPQPSLVAPFPGYGDFYFVGQSFGDGDGVAFTGINFVPNDVNPRSEGTLQLKYAQTGPFVIALESIGDYSLYLYDATGITGGVSSIVFDTYGATGALNGPWPLTYANLYAPVPEPTTYALMLSGLALTGLALRRRKA